MPTTRGTGPSKMSGMQAARPLSEHRYAVLSNHPTPAFSHRVQKTVSIETCIFSYVKQITSPGSMHETRCSGLCTEMTLRDGMGRELGVGFRMGNTCTPMADSCQCMAKTTTIL